MAKVFKISAYLVDPVDEFDEFSLVDCVNYCTQNDISLRHIEIKEVDLGEWDNEIALNNVNCDVAEFERYFKGN